MNLQKWITKRSAEIAEMVTEEAITAKLMEEGKEIKCQFSVRSVNISKQEVYPVVLSLKDREEILSCDWCNRIRKALVVLIENNPKEHDELRKISGNWYRISINFINAKFRAYGLSWRMISTGKSFSREFPLIIHIGTLVKNDSKPIGTLRFKKKLKHENVSD